MTTAYIMMGMPGSGKSHWINQKRIVECTDHHVISSDEWMETNALGYLFDLKELVHAHARCFERYINTLQEGDSVFVDNTNTTFIELAPYIQGARALGARPVVVYVECPLGVAVARNTHGVPADAVDAMQRRIEATLREWPPFWPAPIRVNGEK